MTGTLSQVITLTSFGNDFLLSNEEDTDFTGKLSIQFCNKIDFIILDKTESPGAEKIMLDPNEWYQYLKNAGCKKLRLFYKGSVDQSFAKDYKLAGLIGGGGTWFIMAVYDKHSNAWVNSSGFLQNDDAVPNKGKVNYVEAYHDLPVMDLEFDEQETKKEFQKTLKTIETFALEQDLKFWADQFAKALQVLDSPDPESGYYNNNLIPNGHYSLTARQILYAAGAAWVFGAMGSWNDLSFTKKEDQGKYDALSNRLFDVINLAVLCATNAY